MVDTVAVIYDKLWHRLAEKGMKKQDLREIAGISRASIAKLGKNENVTTEVLDKVCRALQCNIGDIAEIKNTAQDLILLKVLRKAVEYIDLQLAIA